MEELHRALHIAILEIALKLDPELEYTATEAGRDRFCISVDIDEFYEGRNAEVKSLVDLDDEGRDERVATYDREAVCEVLEVVREEIAWLIAQQARLRVHMEIAEVMKRVGGRRTFVCRPLERACDEAKDLEMLDCGGEEVGTGKEVGGEEEDEDGIIMEGDDGVEVEEKLEIQVRKERLSQFKREADVGFEEADLYGEYEEGEEEKNAGSEQMDSPLNRVDGQQKGNKMVVTAVFSSRDELGQ